MDVNIEKHICDLTSVTGGLNESVYHVRVVRKWVVCNALNPEIVDSVDMILLDKRVSYSI
jgi:hypothetical protein